MYFASTYRTKLVLEGYPCQIVASPVSIFFAQVAYPFAKGDPFIKVFSREINRLKNLGIIDKLIKEFEKKGICNENEAATTPIHFENTFSAFVLLAFGTSAAVIFGLLERCLMKVIGTKPQSTPSSPPPFNFIVRS